MDASELSRLLTPRTRHAAPHTGIPPWISPASQQNDFERSHDHEGVLTVTVVVQRTTGVSHSGQYNTVGGQITQANVSTASTVTYTWTLGAGQTLGAATMRTFAAQLGGSGTAHPVTGDTWSVNYTTGGVMRSQTGGF